jgi:prepilin-type N-terminal cleavage/methylation domain-containing protein/prepilin-type processing-associated H-X9-DG protein
MSMPRLPALTRRKSQGFTLIELLAVIAVIGILTAIIIPLIGNVKRKSMVVNDLNNLRQVGVGIHLYAQEHEQTLPGPLYVTQLTHYQENRFPGHLAGMLAEYVGAPPPDEQMRELDVMVDPAWRQAVTNPDDYRATCYRIVQLKPSEVSSDWIKNQSIFGYANYTGQDSSKKTPLKLSLIPDTVALGDIPIITNSNMSELGGQPSHIDRRNVLFLDGHTETFLSADPEFSLYY